MDNMTTQTAGGIPQFTVGDRLRKARETTGLNLQEFADEIGADSWGKDALQTVARARELMAVEVH